MVKQFAGRNTPDGHDAFEQRVREALHREADTIEPSGHGLGAIQARTAKGAGRARARWFAAGGAVMATAAAVTAVVAVSSLDLGLGEEPVPAGPGTADTRPLQIFYVDSTPEKRGEPGSVTEEEPGLYREIRDVAVRTNPVEDAVRELAGSTPQDLDYVNPWAGTTVNSVTVRNERVVVEIDEPLRIPTDAASQQLAHTVQGAAGRDVTVVLAVEGLGQSTPIRPAPPLEAYARLWVTTPEPGATVDSPVAFSGMAATFEGNVAYEILRGGDVVASGATITRGGMGVWSEWTFSERLAPGDYTLVAFDEDPALGGRRDIDTKSFTVR